MPEPWLVRACPGRPGSRPRGSRHWRDAPSAPLVGRKQELTLLGDTVARVVREREPQLVTIVGVPGAALFAAARTHAEELGMRALSAGANPRSRA